MIKLSFSLISVLSTMKSKNPCSNKNSDLWNPSGKSLPMVSLTTLGPANAISASGSAIFRSPNIAKDAVTPPVVGSVKYEIYGKPTKRRSQKINSIKQQIKNLGFSINEREKALSYCQDGKIYMRGKFERMCVNYVNGVFAIDYVVKRSSGKITLE